MNIFKNKILISASILVLIFGLMSVAGMSQEDVELTFWHHEAPSHRVKAFEEVINKFNEAHPNITVEQQVVSWGDAFEKTISAIKSGTTPDFQFDIPDLNLVAYQAGGILPVDEVVQDLDEKYSYYENNLGVYRHHGHHWGVPIWTMDMVLLYRPSMLKEYVGTTKPPSTWEETLEYAEKLTVDKDGDGEIDIHGIGLTASKTLLAQEQLWSVMTTYGAQIYDEQGNVNFNSPETVKALETYKNLWQYSPSSATGWSWGETEMNFAGGKIAMMPYFGGLQRRFYESDNLDLRATRLPTPPDGQRSTILYPNGIMIFKSAEERGVLDEVKEFIQFIMQPEINSIITIGQEPGSFLPVTEATAESDYYWDSEYYYAYPSVNETTVEEVQHGKLYGFTHGEVVNEGIGAVSGANAIAEVAQQLIIEDKSPEEAAEWGQERIEELSD